MLHTFQAFWRDAGLSGEIVSNGGDPVLTYCPRGPVSLSYDASTENDSPALVAFLGGDLAIAYATMTVSDLVVFLVKASAYFDFKHH